MALATVVTVSSLARNDSDEFNWFIAKGSTILTAVIPPMSPKTASPIIAILLILGGAVFGVLDGLHAIYTLLDLRNPRRLVPVDPSVAHAMANSAVRLSGGHGYVASRPRHKFDAIRRTFLATVRAECYLWIWI